MAFEPGSELERGYKLRMVWIAPDEEGDGRVGEATGEDATVGREVEVLLSAGGLGRSWRWWCRRGKGVGGGVGQGLVIMLFGSPLIETKQVLG